jgi:Auxiliary Activity family 9 (formerly GH61)
MYVHFFESTLHTSQLTEDMTGCTEKLIQNNGLLSVDIPNYISGGYYLVRPELLALHQADKSPPNPQFYIGCAQIFLQSNGTAIPRDTVSIPGYVSAGDASVDFNIYTPQWPYPMPGPAPYEGGSRTKGDTKAVALSPQVQKEGLVPNGCILSNANCKSPLK